MIKINVFDLQPDMYIRDLNCGWMEVVGKWSEKQQDSNSNRIRFNSGAIENIVSVTCLVVVITVAI
jgi:hypothetical protein